MRRRFGPLLVSQYHKKKKKKILHDPKIESKDKNGSAVSTRLDVHTCTQRDETGGYSPKSLEDKAITSQVSAKKQTFFFLYLYSGRVGGGWFFFLHPSEKRLTYLYKIHLCIKILGHLLL